MIITINNPQLTTDPNLQMITGVINIKPQNFKDNKGDLQLTNQGRFKTTSQEDLKRINLEIDQIILQEVPSISNKGDLNQTYTKEDGHYYLIRNTPPDT